MKVKKLYTWALATLLAFTFAGCEDDIDPLVTELDLARVLSPIGLEAFIRNNTTIELNWDVKEGVDHYVVEFSEDSLEFTTIIRTVTVAPDELPLQETFFGDTRYSARVKAVAEDGPDDSKWSAITVRTAPENIFNAVENADIEATEVTVTWPAGQEATHFVINPGNTTRNITAGEVSAGEATLTGLTELTTYTVVMYAGNSIRGTTSFKTLVDPEGANAVEVTSGDDLSVVIANAASGSTLVLYPGDYTAYSGSINIDKSIAIRGYYPWDMPKLHVQFSVLAGATDFELGDLDLNGDATLNDVVRFNTADAQYGSLLIEGCNIHDFSRSFVAGNVLSKVASVVIDDCVLTNVLTSGGDFIDFRTTHVTDLKVINSTFNNCAPARDFVRIDNAGFTGTGLNTNVLIDHCTLFGVSNTQDRILYVRFATNTLTVQNTIIAATDGYYTNQVSSSQPTCLNNNYFNAAGFITPAYVANAKIDESGTHTTLDPGFGNAASGDFTLSNQTLIDNGIGDPRWR